VEGTHDGRVARPRRIGSAGLAGLSLADELELGLKAVLVLLSINAVGEAHEVGDSLRRASSSGFFVRFGLRRLIVNL
jgi:hypothetical protein